MPRWIGYGLLGFIYVIYNSSPRCWFPTGFVPYESLKYIPLLNLTLSPTLGIPSPPPVLFCWGGCGLGGSGFFVTVTPTETLNPLPSVVDAVTWADPGLIARIVPPLTVATRVLEDFQESFLFFASVGRILAVIEVDWPSSNDTDDLLSFNSATGRLDVFGACPIIPSILSLLLCADPLWIAPVFTFVKSFGL